MVAGPEHDAERTMVVTSMRGTRRCLDCITAKTNVPPSRVRDIVDRAQSIVRLAEPAAICSGCFRTLTVYGLGWRPGDGMLA